MKRSVLALIAGAMIVVALSPAQAVPVGFEGINADQGDLSNQLSVDVSQLGGQGGNIQFVFTNNVGTPSSITQIYFDWTPDTLFSGTIAISSQTGVSFSVAGNPGNFPEGNNVNPTFEANAEAGPTSQGGVSNNGINASGDSLTIVLDPTSNTFLLTHLIGALRIGLHVQAIGTGGLSDSYISNPLTPGTFSAVPIPPAAALFVTGLVGLASLSMRKKRRRKTA